MDVVTHFNQSVKEGFTFPCLHVLSLDYTKAKRVFIIFDILGNLLFAKTEIWKMETYLFLHNYDNYYYPSAT